MIVLSRKRGQSLKIGPNISIIVLNSDDAGVRLGVKVSDDWAARACLCDPPLREFVERWRERSELLAAKQAG